MKTLNTFVPSLRGSVYVRVSTSRLCPEPADSESLRLLRESLRQLAATLSYYREHGYLAGAETEEEEAEARAEKALAALVAELHRRELVFFTPAAGRVLPDWSRIVSVRQQLEPLLAALDEELRFLLRAAPFVKYGAFCIHRHLQPRLGLVPEPEEYAASLRLHEVQLNRPSLLCGGEGFSIETAFLIPVAEYKTPHTVGHMFRYAYEAEPTRRYSVEQNGRHYEVLIWDKRGDKGERVEHTFWFDITAYRKQQLFAMSSFA